MGQGQYDTASIKLSQLSDFCPRRPYKRVQNGAKQTAEFPLFCCIWLSGFVPRLGRNCATNQKAGRLSSII